jgi:hypothetical protein
MVVGAFTHVKAAERTSPIALPKASMESATLALSS